MEKITESKIWLIMSKDRKIVAKGTPRNRRLVLVADKDKKRFLTYTSRGMAEAGFKYNGFYGMGLLGEGELEAVEATITITI